MEWRRETSERVARSAGGGARGGSRRVRSAPTAGQWGRFAAFTLSGGAFGRSSGSRTEISTRHVYARRSRDRRAVGAPARTRRAGRIKGRERLPVAWKQNPAARNLPFNGEATHGRMIGAAVFVSSNAIWD